MLPPETGSLHGDYSDGAQYRFEDWLVENAEFIQK